MCPNGDVYGFRQRAQGAWAEYVLLPADALNYKVPDTVAPQHAAYIEPLACSVHAVQRAEIKLDDVVVLAGAGPLGLGMVATARLQNPKLLIVLDLNDDRLEDRQAVRGRPGLQPRQGRCDRRSQQTDRRLWL